MRRGGGEMEGGRKRGKGRGGMDFLDLDMVSRVEICLLLFFFFFCLFFLLSNHTRKHRIILIL